MTFEMRKTLNNIKKQAWSNPEYAAAQIASRQNRKPDTKETKTKKSESAKLAWQKRKETSQSA
jgi:hypothetical protein